MQLRAPTRTTGAAITNTPVAATLKHSKRHRITDRDVGPKVASQPELVAQPRRAGPPLHMGQRVKE